MYILTNKGNSPAALPGVGLVNPGHSRNISDDVHADLVSRPVVLSWVDAGRISFAETKQGGEQTTQEKPAKKANPNTPDKVAIIDELASYGIIRTTKTSAKKLRALLADAQSAQ